MTLWWLQPGWTKARCACGATIWPEGDPDWGACFTCFSAQMEDPRMRDEEERYYAEMEAAERARKAPRP